MNNNSKNMIALRAGITLLMLVFLTASQCRAGKDPEILKIFDKYGNKQGVTMLEISDDLMKNYHVRIFKSIIFEDGRKALTDIRKAIDIDKVNAKKIKESKQDGLLISGYYRLKTENDNLNRYLIFKIGKNNRTTLVYIEGELTPEELVELLK